MMMFVWRKKTILIQEEGVRKNEKLENENTSRKNKKKR